MDINALRERQTPTTMTVTDLNEFIKNMFDSNRILTSVTVKGEISNFVYHRSGHMYFSLKDEGSQIRAVMFRSSASLLKFLPEDGMKVIIHGSVSVYTQGGAYQLYASSMQPDGMGALYLAYEQMKARLEREGLFDKGHKTAIPRFPEKIGVITSPTGAAVRDIINVISRRYPLAAIYLYPALVQGDGAEESLCGALEFFDRSGLSDVVIIGRGGGSIEDLWAFNSEKLARLIYDASVPVISAVGHETDFTICDFVSDLRAPTPSAAAELAVPDIRELCITVDSYSDRLDLALLSVLERGRARLNTITERDVLRYPENIIKERREAVGGLKDDARSFMEDIIKDLSNRMVHSLGKLEALSPLAVLKRGYSVVELGDTIINDPSVLKVGDSISIRTSGGSIDATVEKINVEK